LKTECLAGNVGTKMCQTMKEIREEIKKACKPNKDEIKRLKRAFKNDLEIAKR